MTGYLYRGRDWNSTSREESLRRIERATSSTFCEAGRCDRVADWRIGYGTQSVELCARHALATMRNRKIWQAP
jgi:hypothetical protein